MPDTDQLPPDLFTVDGKTVFPQIDMSTGRILRYLSYRAVVVPKPEGDQEVGEISDLWKLANGQRGINA
jgi:hypothetical protein